MRNLLGAIAGLATLIFATSANATIVVNGGDLSTSSPTGVDFNNLDGDIASGPDAEVDIDIDGDVGLARVEVTVVEDAGDVLPNIEDLVVTILDDQDNVLAVGEVTDSTGALNGSAPFTFDVDLSGLTSFTIALSGTANPNVAGTNFPDVNVSISAIPVPAALPLLLSGIAGLGLASRRRKKELA